MAGDWAQHMWTITRGAEYRRERGRRREGEQGRNSDRGINNASTTLHHEIPLIIRELIATIKRRAGQRDRCFLSLTPNTDAVMIRGRGFNRREPFKVPDMMKKRGKTSLQVSIMLCATPELDKSR